MNYAIFHYIYTDAAAAGVAASNEIGYWILDNESIHHFACLGFSLASQNGGYGM
jgi:hypothetical protein